MNNRSNNLNRRHLMNAALTTTAIATLGTVREAEAAPAQLKTFVFVHGAWHNSHHWQPVASRLAARGHVVATIDLLGHGLFARFPASYISGDVAGLAKEPSPVGKVSLEEAAQRVADTLKSFGSGPVTLVGHSLGGAIITRAAELAPDHIGKLIYLTAFVPVGLRSAGAYGALPEFQTGYGQTLFVANPADIGAVRINPRGDVNYLQKLRETYYNDVAYDAFLPFAAGLTPDLPIAFWIGEVETTPQRWGAIPRAFIRCGLDRALAPAVQDRMIADADRVTPNNKFQVERLETSHSAFASAPEELVRLLVKLA